MKEQTFISIFEDANGRTVDFERWADKRLSTVKRKVFLLYKKYPFMLRDITKKAVKLAIYQTEASGKHMNTAYECDMQEFLSKIA